MGSPGSIFTVVILLVLTMLISFHCYFLWRRARKRKYKILLKENCKYYDCNNNILICNYAVISAKKVCKLNNLPYPCLVGQESVTLEGLQFDLAIIEAATNNFSNENKIGKGGFGEVYR